MGNGEQGTAFTCSNVVAKYTYKATEKDKKGKKRTVTKTLTRTFALTVSPVPVVPNVADVPIRGVATLTEAARPAGGSGQEAKIAAWQNLWGSAYKDAGKRLFYASKKKPYRTFALTVDVDGQSCALSLKVTPSGAVTATLTYKTGRKNKGKVEYHKPTCSTVVIPTSLPKADPFTGEAFLYFAPVPTKNFPGLVGTVPF